MEDIMENTETSLENYAGNHGEEDRSQVRKKKRVDMPELEEATAGRKTEKKKEKNLL